MRLDLEEIVKKNASPEDQWQQVLNHCRKTKIPFDELRKAFDQIFSSWNEVENGPPPVWQPTEEERSTLNLSKFMHRLGFSSYEELHSFSVDDRSKFWKETLQEMNLAFREKPQEILGGDAEQPIWLRGASLNIIDSCFSGPDGPALIVDGEGRERIEYSREELKQEAFRFGAALVAAGIKKGDRVAIDLPMHEKAVIAYLGIQSAGASVVSIADSFADKEIATRLRISDAKLMVTQDFMGRAGKTISLYEKVKSAESPKAIVIRTKGDTPLREGDVDWGDFVGEEKLDSATQCLPEDEINVLFSSGTTGDPKAIPWTHLTGIKSAADGFFHHDIQEGDRVAWPTNLGWMMGPWLIFAALVNRGTITIFDGLPTVRAFGEFVEKERITMLGLVPSIVKQWKATGCMEGLDFSSIKCFSPTGECSNVEDYLFLMSLANFRPVVEYCGGTEIGGGYITQTLLQSASPAAFSTPALGLTFEVHSSGEEALVDQGEVFLVPPSIGLSTRLLNRDHHEVYFEGTPKGKGGRLLRRHGDQLEVLGKGYYRALGRADDTMNLGGIKISSAELERAMNHVDHVRETAAVAITPLGGGPSELVVFAVMEEDLPEEELLRSLQARVRAEINPLFKIKKVEVCPALPRTASNKIMRRVLRAQFEARLSR